MTQTSERCRSTARRQGASIEDVTTEEVQQHDDDDENDGAHGDDDVVEEEVVIGYSWGACGGGSSSTSQRTTNNELERVVCHKTVRAEDGCLRPLLLFAPPGPKRPERDARRAPGIVGNVLMAIAITCVCCGATGAFLVFVFGIRPCQVRTSRLEARERDATQRTKCGATSAPLLFFTHPLRS